MWTIIAGRVKRLSLRQQQLWFFAVVTIFVILLIASTVGVATRYSAVFGDSLNRYFQIQSLRSELADIHARLEAHFRSKDPQVREEIVAAAPQVWWSFRNLAALEFEDVPSILEIRATYYGLRAYESSAIDALARLEAGDEGAYVALARAGQIRLYVDSYLERLFQVQLAEGRRGYDAAIAQQRVIGVLGFSGIILVGVALTIFALFFSRSVMQPLERLVAEAHALAAGDFDRPELEVPESSDLREVALAFNRMTAGIRRLVGDLTDQHDLERKLHQQEFANLSMERLLREAQLVALQSQINPHFLFNTLNSVARTTRLEGAERSERLIRGLSAVLRYILRNPRRSVAMREELRVVEEYLALQEVRFGSRLSYRFELSEECLDAQIPPLIFQPLVENAVLYGIEPLERGGTVVVSASRDTAGETLVISITDDGAGMEAEQVEHLLQKEIGTTGDSTSGIGILNVRARLELFFGTAQLFQIESSPGRGTRIHIHIPFQHEAETYGL